MNETNAFWDFSHHLMDVLHELAWDDVRFKDEVVLQDQVKVIILFLSDDGPNQHVREQTTNMTFYHWNLPITDQRASNC